MIRSSKTSTKFTNRNKINDLHKIIDEYRNVVSYFIDVLWENEKITKFIPKEYTEKCQTWLSVRMIQCAAKQASGIVSGTKKKQSQRKYIIDKLITDGKYKQARKLQVIYDKITTSKPNIDNICPELDSRFVKINVNNKTIFDGWVILQSIGKGMKINIPFKKTKHFNKMLERGNLKTGIRLSKSGITFMFDITETKVENGSTLGIDIGQKTMLSCSNGVTSQKIIMVMT